MRSPDDQDGLGRGYEWWLMQEAKKRNPSIQLLGLVYAWPGWIYTNGTYPFASMATNARAARYVTSWE